MEEQNIFGDLSYDIKKNLLANFFYKVAGEKFDNNFISEKERTSKKIRYGMKKFRRNAMGYSDDTTKTFNGLAKLLFKTGAVSSTEEGKELIPSIIGKSLEVTGGSVFDIPFSRLRYWDGIYFHKVKNEEGSICYKVGLYHHEYGP